MKLFLQCLIRLDQCSKQVTNPMVILMKLTSVFFFGKDKKKNTGHTIEIYSLAC